MYYINYNLFITYSTIFSILHNERRPPLYIISPEIIKKTIVSHILSIKKIILWSVIMRKRI